MKAAEFRCIKGGGPNLDSSRVLNWAGLFPERSMISSSKAQHLPQPHLQLCLQQTSKTLLITNIIGTKSMQNASAYEEPRSSGKQLHEYCNKQ